jgi:hypothetical protein
MARNGRCRTTPGDYQASDHDFYASRQHEGVQQRAFFCYQGTNGDFQVAMEAASTVNEAPVRDSTAPRSTLYARWHQLGSRRAQEDAQTTSRWLSHDGRYLPSAASSIVDAMRTISRIGWPKGVRGVGLYTPGR